MVSLTIAGVCCGAWSLAFLPTVGRFRVGAGPNLGPQSINAGTVVLPSSPEAIHWNENDLSMRDQYHHKQTVCQNTTTLKHHPETFIQPGSASTQDAQNLIGNGISIKAWAAEKILGYKNQIRYKVTATCTVQDFPVLSLACESSVSGLWIRAVPDAPLLPKVARGQTAPVGPASSNWNGKQESQVTIFFKMFWWLRTGSFSYKGREWPWMFPLGKAVLLQPLAPDRYIPWRLRWDRRCSHCPPPSWTIPHALEVKREKSSKHQHEGRGLYCISRCCPLLQVPFHGERAPTE